MLQDARDQLKASPEGMAAPPSELYLTKANYGQNLVAGGGMESYSLGTAREPDGWQTGGAGAVAKNTTNVKEGSASADLTNTASNSFLIEQQTSKQITISATVNQELRGEYVTFSCWVKCSTASRAFIKISDGVGSSSSAYHTGDGNFQLLVISHLISATATKVVPSCEIATGTAITATFDAAVMVRGKTAVAFSKHPYDQSFLISNYQNDVPANASLQVYRMETGIKSSSASAGVSITFATAYTTLVGILLTPDIGSAGMATFDGDSASGFTIHLWDAAGARIASVVTWSAWGVG